MDRSKKTHFLIVLPKALLFTLISSYSLALADSKTDQAESAWVQAQKEYYDALKKLKTPRDPKKVQELKDQILVPKKEALQKAYQFQPESELSPQQSKTSSSSPQPVEKPAIVLDGKNVKMEIRYFKKGAPPDMTLEESPESLGPQIISETGETGTGEIAYPAKKTK